MHNNEKGFCPTRPRFILKLREIILKSGGALIHKHNDLYGITAPRIIQIAQSLQNLMMLISSLEQFVGKCQGHHQANQA